MQVQLIVVQGKPEGKVIPLLGPQFKIGRGETCHLRPNSELVSREHAEFTITADAVSVRDLGSRNGTLVNGKALTETYTLKDRDLVQVGPLTFAVSIQDAPAAAAAPAAPATSTDEASHDDIDSWLFTDNADRPAGVYGGDTITIKAFKDASAAKPAPSPSASDVNDEEYERLPDAEVETKDELEAMGDQDDESESAAATLDELPEDMIDESNPFYTKKKSDVPDKPVYKDTSDAASDILRKMLERRRASKSS
jgi:predicted component of type VI protein secretion system